MISDWTLTPLKTALACGAAAAALLAVPAQALPVPGQGPAQVAGGGQPTVSSSGPQMTVNINAARTIIDWSSFNVGASEGVTFNFGQRAWIVLNRTNSAISIDGQLRAIHTPTNAVGGNVWFYSPQGVAFGPGARVDVGAMLATSAAPSTAD